MQVVQSRQECGPANTVLQSAAAADGNGFVASVGGLNGAVLVEVENSAGSGSCSITLQGRFSFSPANQWYNTGYQRVDNQATLTRLVGASAIVAHDAQVFQILDYYDEIRAVITNTAGAIVINANVRGLAA